MSSINIFHFPISTRTPTMALQLHDNFVSRVLLAVPVFISFYEHGKYYVGQLAITNHYILIHYLPDRVDVRLYNTLYGETCKQLMKLELTCAVEFRIETTKIIANECQSVFLLNDMIALPT